MQNYVVYKLISPENKYYIGITNNFKRRLKEHGSSKYPIGRALRKHGKQNFKVEFLNAECTLEEALALEAHFIGVEQVKDHDCYNICLGGIPSLTMSSEFNPMKNPEVVKAHPNIWSALNNPMRNEISKQRMISSQKIKAVEVGGIRYYGVREAARRLNMSRQKLVYRLKSDTFPTHKYIG